MAMQTRAAGVLCLARQRKKPSKSDRAQASMTMGMKMSGSPSRVARMQNLLRNLRVHIQASTGLSNGRPADMENAAPSRTRVPCPPPRDVGITPHVWMHNSIWSGQKLIAWRFAISDLDLNT